MTDDRPNLSEDRVRAGRTVPMMRVILIVSMLLVIVIFGLLFWNG
ncbi:hypothetical protein [Parasphingopyxis sp.]|nr:hypothetical protein [Parasphingopyxis sp.]